MPHSHINVIVRRVREVNDLLAFKTLETERDFWREQAEYWRRQVVNIPEALVEFGDCYIVDEDGKQWNLKLDPEKHPKTESQ